MAERFLSVRPHGPNPPFSLVNSASPQIGPQRSRARSGEAYPLTARTDLESFATRERGFKSEGARGYRLGSRLALGPSASVSIEAQRREHPAAPINHALLVLGTLQF